MKKSTHINLLNPGCLPLSKLIALARTQLSDSRRFLQEAVFEHGVFGDQLECVKGLLTCGISTLYGIMQEVAKFEIKCIDEKRGPHIKFMPRGIGLDANLACFVCQATQRGPQAVNDYLHNIAAFLNTPEDGKTVSGWFDGLGCTDLRRAPERVQFKVGTCSLHKPSLEFLYKVTSEYGVLRQLDIKEARQVPPATEPEA